MSAANGWVQRMDECSEWMSAANGWVQRIDECSEWMSAANRWVQRMDECSEWMSAANGWVQRMDECSEWMSAANGWVNNNNKEAFNTRGAINLRNTPKRLKKPEESITIYYERLYKSPRKYINTYEVERSL
jgi:hypothetical protein